MKRGEMKKNFDFGTDCHTFRTYNYFSERESKSVERFRKILG